MSLLPIQQSVVQLLHHLSLGVAATVTTVVVSRVFWHIKFEVKS